MKTHMLPSSSVSSIGRDRRRVATALIVTPALIAAVLMPRSSRAQSATWTGAVSGNFGTGANWKNKAVPGATFSVTLDSANLAGNKITAITGAAASTNKSLLVKEGSFKLSAAGGVYTVTGRVNITGVLPFPGGPFKGTLLTFTGGGTLDTTHTLLAARAGSTGSLTVDMQSTWNSETVSVGFRGRGSMDIRSGATVNDAVGTIAERAGSTGNVDVVGGASWSNQLLVVGDGGAHGNLRVFGGGKVTSATSVVGNAAGTTGTVFVGNMRSGFNTGELVVGQNGTGIISVQNGGTVTATDATLGNSATGTGTVTVSGKTSLWGITNNLTIGNDGNGSLMVLNQANARVIGTTNVGTGGSVTVNGGSFTTGLLEGKGPVTLTAGPGGQNNYALTIDAANGTATYQGVISGAGDVLKTGASTQMFTGMNTDMGLLWDKSKTVVFANGGKWGGNLKVGDAAANVINDGVVAGSTEVDSHGLAQGTGVYGNVHVLAGGTMFPGDSGPGMLSVLGTYAQDNGGILDISIGGTIPGSGFSQLNVCGPATIQDGILQVDLLNGFQPTNGELFVVLTSTGLNATFTDPTIQLGDVTFLVLDSPPGYANDVVLEAITPSSVPEPSSLVLSLSALAMLGGICAYRRLRRRLAFTINRE
jgi:T5SS/PEP-CTERM-associated repeat protein